MAKIVEKANHLPSEKIVYSVDDKTNLNNKTLNANDFKNNKKTHIILFAIFSLFLLISLLRVPFVGSVIDAILFDYLYGIGKYLIYLWLMILTIIMFFNFDRFKFFLKPLTLLLQIFIIISLSILISTIATSIQDHDIWKMVGYSASTRMKIYANHFFVYLKNFYHYKFSINSSWFVNTYLKISDKYLLLFTGGLIGELIVCLYQVFVILFSIMFLIISILLIIAHANLKFKQKLHNIVRILCKKFVRVVINNELIKERINQKIYHIDQNKIKEIASHNQILTPPISFLSDLSIDNYSINKDYANDIKTKIKEWNKKQSFSLVYDSEIIMPQYIKLIYTCDNKKDIESILKNGNEIIKVLSIKSLLFFQKHNKLIIQIPINDKKISKISIKSILLKQLINPNSNYAIIGTSEEDDNLVIDFNKESNLLIVGSKYISNINKLLTTIIISYAFLNTPYGFNIDVIGYQSNKFISYMKDLKHVTSISLYDDIDSSKVFQILQKIIKEIDIREKKMSLLKISDFNAYNWHYHSLPTEQMPRKILVVNNFNLIIHNNSVISSLLANIMAKGKKCGIHVILTSHNVDNDILENKIMNKIDTKLILKLDSTQESINIMDGSEKAFWLFGAGDGYYINKHSKKIKRFQACYTNGNEINQINKIIWDFYKVKKEKNII